MAIPKKRLEDLACQFLMLTEMLSIENGLDVYEVLQKLSNVTNEELMELNFPFKIYCRHQWKMQQEKEKEKKNHGKGYGNVRQNRNMCK